MQPRTIIPIGQNETGRININKTKNTDILITDLEHCVCIVFKDTFGNISATHADADTILHFLKAEAKFMQGPYTIDVIKFEGSISILAEEVVLPSIKHLFGKITNSKGEIDKARITKTKTVLLRDKNKMLTPKIYHIDELIRGAALSKDNPLENCIIEDAAKPSAMRGLERHIVTVLEKEKAFPTVVYDNGWTGLFPKMSEETQRKVDSAEQLETHESLKYLRNEAITALDIHNRPMAERFPARVHDYFHLRSKDLYTHVHRFFKSSNIVIPAKGVALITAYAHEPKKEADDCSAQFNKWIYRHR